MKFDRIFKKTIKDNEGDPSDSRPEVPDGLLKKCNVCKSGVFVSDVVNNYNICPRCHNYFRMDAYSRVGMLVDEGSFEEWDMGLKSNNPLSIRNYQEKLEGLQEKTGLDEAVITGKAVIDGVPVVFGVCDGRFLMASMGEVVGEKIARAVERATKEKLPIILFACSGGARMQEGIISLMQMAKTSAALKQHSDAGLLYISVLTDPTTGGVTASFAMLGDIILAEPGALIGFAGPRVIEQTIGQKLPKGFQRSEFLLEHGFLDGIIEREKMRETLSLILHQHQQEQNANGVNHVLESVLTPDAVTRDEVLKQIFQEAFDEGKALKKVNAWKHVELARDKSRPTGRKYIDLLFQDFVEMHGDRYYRDDPAVVGGVAYFHGMPVTILIQEKGQGTKESIERNFGMVSPDGYRKSLRLMKQAEKFGRPVICLVDTPGAFCGLEAEERGQGEAIARNIYELSALKVPVLSIVIGEGGSGGALAFAVSDEVWMMENSIYSILSPEGFASILWKDSKRAKEAAGIMKMTARDLKKLGIVEHVIREDEPLTHENLTFTIPKLEVGIAGFLQEYTSFTEKELLERRYRRFRRF